jgi:hypothetical protein
LPQPSTGQPSFCPWLPRCHGDQAGYPTSARRTSRQGMQISTVNRPSISLKGPVKVPQNEPCVRPLRFSAGHGVWIIGALTTG